MPNIKVYFANMGKKYLTKIVSKLYYHFCYKYELKFLKLIHLIQKMTSNKLFKKSILFLLHQVVPIYAALDFKQKNPKHAVKTIPQQLRHLIGGSRIKINLKIIQKIFVLS